MGIEVNKVFIFGNIDGLPVSEAGYHDFHIIKGIKDSFVQKYYTLHFVLSGEGVFNINNNTYELSKGNVFFIAPDMPRSYYPKEDNPWCYVWFLFYDKVYADFLNVAGISGENPVCRTGKLFEIEQILNRLFNQMPENARAYESAAAFYGAISMLIREKSNIEAAADNPDYYVQKALDMISANYQNPNFNVQTLCKNEMHMSRSYLGRIFKAATRKSLSDYIMFLRYDNAARLLAESELSVKQISLSVGVGDVIHFYKQFKKLFGITATGYRDSRKKT